MTKKAFFGIKTLKDLTPLGSIASGIGGLLGPSKADIAAQQALEASKQRTFQAAENQKTRTLNTQQQEASQRQQASTKRAEALDRILSTFQQTLR